MFINQVQFNTHHPYLVIDRDGTERRFSNLWCAMHSVIVGEGWEVHAMGKVYDRGACMMMFQNPASDDLGIVVKPHPAIRVN